MRNWLSVSFSSLLSGYCNDWSISPGSKDMSWNDHSFEVSLSQFQSKECYSEHTILPSSSTILTMTITKRASRDVSSFVYSMMINGDECWNPDLQKLKNENKREIVSSDEEDEILHEDRYHY